MQLNLKFKDIESAKPVLIQAAKSQLNVIFSNVCTDSRAIKSGDLFFAFKGDKFDAHEYIEQVFSSGAAACVVNQYWYEDNKDNFKDKFLISVDSVESYFARLATVYRKRFDIPIIAIGGSNGKTSVKEMTAAVLSRKYNVLKTEGNLNNHLGVPMTIFRLHSEHEIAVVEIGTNHFGELDYLCEILEPGLGLLTNIGNEHLEFFGDLEGVTKAESELFEYLGENDGTAFLNTDDDLLKTLFPLLKKFITYGFNNKPAIKGEFITLDAAACAEISVKGPVGETAIQLPIPGKHTANNALAAATVGIYFGVSLPEIKIALETVKTASKRMEVIERNGIVFLSDCYNANPDSLNAALDTLKQMQNTGRKIAVLGDMREMGKEAANAHREAGKKIASLDFDLICTFGEMMKLVYNEVQNVSEKKSIHFENKSELTDYLKKNLTVGDVVLMKASRASRLEEVLERFIHPSQYP